MDTNPLEKVAEVAQAAEAVQALAAAPTPSDTSKPWQSKTLWVAAITCVLPLIPGFGAMASAWIGANPELFTAGLSALFGGLRLVTKNQISIK